MGKLTIGMAVYDDFDGLYFTIQSIRMFHKECLKDIEFVIIDNNPDSTHGKAVSKIKNYVKEPLQYIPFTEYTSTIVRNLVFEMSNTPYTLCLDPHVLIDSQALSKLINFYDEGRDEGNLLQGPIIHEDLKYVSTHFTNKWSNNGTWGTWGRDPRGFEADMDPFEVVAQGLGLFSCRTDAWLGFNKNFRGFGVEENYIHEKYRQHGKKTLCLPFLRWMHRFSRPNGAPHKVYAIDKFRNYLIGHYELNLPTDKIRESFKTKLTQEQMDKIETEVKALLNIT